MALDYNELLARVIATAKEALAALSPAVTADGVPYFLYTQEAFPYFTARVGADEVSYDSHDFDRDTLTVILRLVIGHVTENYIGEPENILYDYIPQVKLYMNDHELLQSAAYPTAMVGLLEARCTSHIGFRVFQNAGISAQQVGTEFTITCELDETVSQAYT